MHQNDHRRERNWLRREAVYFCRFTRDSFQGKSEFHKLLAVAINFRQHCKWHLGKTFQAQRISLSSRLKQSEQGSVVFARQPVTFTSRIVCEERVDHDLYPFASQACCCLETGFLPPEKRAVDSVAPCVAHHALYTVLPTINLQRWGKVAWSFSCNGQLEKQVFTVKISSILWLFSPKLLLLFFILTWKFLLLFCIFDDFFGVRRRQRKCEMTEHVTSPDTASQKMTISHKIPKTQHPELLEMSLASLTIPRKQQNGSLGRYNTAQKRTPDTSDAW